MSTRHSSWARLDIDLRKMISAPIQSRCRLKRLSGVYLEAWPAIRRAGFDDQDVHLGDEQGRIQTQDLRFLHRMQFGDFLHHRSLPYRQIDENRLTGHKRGLQERLELISISCERNGDRTEQIQACSREYKE